MNIFSRARRITHKTEFQRVFQDSKRIVCPHFVIIYCENALGYSRLGLALSKKMIAKAHDRARIKRLVRETFRTQVDMHPVDIVVLARSRTAHQDNAVLMSELRQAWINLGSRAPCNV